MWHLFHGWCSQEGNCPFFHRWAPQDQAFLKLTRQEICFPSSSACLFSARQSLGVLGRGRCTPFQWLASQWLAKAWGARLGKLHWFFNAQPFQNCPVHRVLAQGNCTPSSMAGLSQAAHALGCQARESVHPFPWLASLGLDRPMSARLEKIHLLFQSWPPQGLPVSGVQDRKDFLPLTQLVFWGVPDSGVSNCVMCTYSSMTPRMGKLHFRLPWLASPVLSRPLETGLGSWTPSATADLPKASQTLCIQAGECYAPSSSAGLLKPGQALWCQVGEDLYPLTQLIFWVRTGPGVHS